MTTRKLMLLGAMALMSSVAPLNDLRAAPQRRRAENLVSLVAVAPVPQPVDSSGAPSGMVVIPATGKSLKQPDVTLFRSVVLLQKLGTLLEKAPQR